VAVANLKVQVHYCQLTGAANTLSGCTIGLPINMPYMAFRPESTDQYYSSYFAPDPVAAWCPLDGGQPNCKKSEQSSAVASLYNAAGTILKANQTPYAINANGTFIQFDGSYISPNTRYHVLPGNIASGWVLITGGSAVSMTWKPQYAGYPFAPPFTPYS
jgi:hypothetical protein